MYDVITKANSVVSIDYLDPKYLVFLEKLLTLEGLTAEDAFHINAAIMNAKDDGRFQGTFHFALEACRKHNPPWLFRDLIAIVATKTNWGPHLYG
jgi:hypothetical protein